MIRLEFNPTRDHIKCVCVRVCLCHFHTLRLLADKQVHVAYNGYRQCTLVLLRYAKEWARLDTLKCVWHMDILLVIGCLGSCRVYWVFEWDCRCNLKPPYITNMPAHVEAEALCNFSAPGTVSRTCITQRERCNFR